MRGNVRNTSNFGAGPSDAGHLNTPQTVKKCGLFWRRNELTNVLDDDRLLSPKRPGGPDVPNRRTAGKSATFRESFSTKLRNAMSATNWSLTPPPPLCLQTWGGDARAQTREC